MRHGRHRRRCGRLGFRRTVSTKRLEDAGKYLRQSLAETRSFSVCCVEPKVARQIVHVAKGLRPDVLVVPPPVVGTY